ncbi:hypothetical protein PLACP1_07000 [Planifilum fimeticola]
MPANSPSTSAIKYSRPTGRIFQQLTLFAQRRTKFPRFKHQIVGLADDFLNMGDGFLRILRNGFPKDQPSPVGQG